MKLTRALTPLEKATARLILEWLGEQNGVSALSILERGREPLRDRLIVELYEALRVEGWSYPKIARYTGRDHSTVVQAIRGRRGVPGASSGRGGTVSGEAVEGDTSKPGFQPKRHP